MVPEWSDQARFDVRFEWGPTGVHALASQMVVVVDVLRFTTAVDVAVGRGVRVHPHRWRDESADALAVSLGAVLADGSAGPGLALAHQPPAPVARQPRGAPVAERLDVRGPGR